MVSLSELLFGKDLTAREYLQRFGKTWFGIPDIEPWLKKCAACGEEFLVRPDPDGFERRFIKRCRRCRLDNKQVLVAEASH